MRALVAILIFLCAGVSEQSAARAQSGDFGAVKLDEICKTPKVPNCVVKLSIDGMFTAATARSFVSLLELEAERVGASLTPLVMIQSTGGDLSAAMTIGREIRKRTGSVGSRGPCHSACVFAAMGGVERNLAGIGLHRPYFANFNTNGFAEADARYKNMVRLIVDYMFEMNVSEDLLRAMLAVPPGEMRILSGLEARRIGLNGVDPAYDEFRTGQEAAQYGVNSAELRRRHADLEKQCGREEEMRSLADMHKRDECKAQSRERVLWGLDEEKFAALRRSANERCNRFAPESPELRTCMRTLADTIRREPPKR